MWKFYIISLFSIVLVAVFRPTKTIDTTPYTPDDPDYAFKEFPEKEWTIMAKSRPEYSLDREKNEYEVIEQEGRKPPLYRIKFNNEYKYIKKTDIDLCPKFKFVFRDSAGCFCSEGREPFELHGLKVYDIKGASDPIKGHTLLEGTALAGWTKNKFIDRNIQCFGKTFSPDTKQFLDRRDLRMAAYITSVVRLSDIAAISVVQPTFRAGFGAYGMALLVSDRGIKETDVEDLLKQYYEIPISFRRTRTCTVRYYELFCE